MTTQTYATILLPMGCQPDK